MSAVGVAPMQVGQAHLWADRPVGRYVLQVPQGDVFPIIATGYAELEDDTRRHGDDGDPLWRALSSLQWPPLERLATEASDAFRELMSFFGYDILLALEMQRSAPTCAHVLISIDGVVCRDGDVEFSGVAVQLARSPAVH